MSETNANIVWSPDKGWHDGPEVKVTLDKKGRLTTELGGHTYEQVERWFDAAESAR